MDINRSSVKSRLGEVPFCPTGHKGWVDSGSGMGGSPPARPGPLSLGGPSAQLRAVAPASEVTPPAGGPRLTPQEPHWSRLGLQWSACRDYHCKRSTQA